MLIRPNGIMVQAFDGTKTSTCVEIDRKVLIGPCEFEVFFLLADIPAVFNLLLEHPGIHSAGTIPYSLHQRVKFITSNKLITIMIKEDVHVPPPLWYHALTPNRWTQLQHIILLCL